MTTARLRLELPETTWIEGLSREHPGARFRLLAGLPTDEGAVELGEIRSVGDPSVAAAAVRDHPAVSAYEPVFDTAERMLARYETDDTSLYSLLGDVSLPLDFPVEVHDGWMEFEVSGARERIASFRSALEASSLQSEVRWITDLPTGDQLLTSRQREVLETAVAMGYYEVPRGCTLAEVAATLDVDKSTASGILRRGTERIITQFLSAAPSDDPR